VTGYVLDDLALIAGLGHAGTEHDRREVSRLLHDALKGGPVVDLPALCLTAAATVRSAIVDHVAGMVAEAPAGAIDIAGLVRTSQLDAVRAWRPDLGWAGAHAAVEALATGRQVLTVKPERYAGTGVDAMPL
jgi:hypothetical protein